MKAKRILALLITVIMVVSLLPISSLTALALEASDKVKEVELTIPAPVAGDAVNLDCSSVTVEHFMTYKVVGVNWYKNHEKDHLGIGDADKYFIGGQSYTVRIDLAVKAGNSGWNIDYKGEETDYSGIKATINGKAATVTHRELNPDAKTISVLYTFEYIPVREITPSVVIPAPIAGGTYPKNDTLKTSGDRLMRVASLDYGWFVPDGEADDCGKGYSRMGDTETFAAGICYRVALKIEAREGFRFRIEDAYSVGTDRCIDGYVNGKKVPMKLTKLGVNDEGDVYSDQQVTVVYDLAPCKANEIGSVSFSGIVAPKQGEKPAYIAPTMGDDSYFLVLNDAVTGGAEYGFVGGIQWATATEKLTVDSTFEAGKSYTLTFFIRSGDAYRFAEWVEGEANVGSVEIVTMVDDPTLAAVTVSFAPCESGELTSVLVSGVREPVKGETPDYDFIYGEGFDRGGFDGDIAWYNASTDQPLTAEDVFKYGEIYELRMTLRSDAAVDGASAKFKFAPLENLSVKVNGRETDALRQYENKSESEYVFITVAYECAKAPIREISVTVEAPVEDKTPAEVISVDGGAPLLIDEFVFCDGESGEILAKDATFVGGYNYLFRITLRATEGYRFDAEKLAATINGDYAFVIRSTEGSVSLGVYLLANEAPYSIVTFNAGEGGTGTMEDIKVKIGSYTLPECEFTAPEGKRFLAWSTDGMASGAVAGTVELTEGTLSLTALWESENEHTHVYGSEFNGHDDLGHYKLCISPNCPQLGSLETKSIAPGDDMGHNWGNNTNCDTTCLDCGYVRTVNQAGEPLHFYEFECSEFCPSCGLRRESATHKPGADATCTENKTCSLCDKILESASGHTPGDAANCGHDQTCTTCGEVLAEKQGEHVPGADATCTAPQKCTVCDTVLKEASGHSAGVEWITDETGHHKLCSCGDKVNAGEHTDTDGDKACDACGFRMSAGLAVWAIVLIVVGAVTVLGGGGVCLYLFVIRKKK